MNNFQADHNYKVEQFRTRIADLRDTLEKQQKESQKIAIRIAQKKEGLEQCTIKKNELLHEIEITQ